MSGSRAQELYNLARYAKVTLPSPKKIPFILNATDLYVILVFSKLRENAFSIWRSQ